MDIFSAISLFGGLALFLYGMRLMGNNLKESSSGTLKIVIGKLTDNAVKAFFVGMIMTAIIQSSTATIVITSGLVAAGVISLNQSFGIIVGANVGTTVTGQIIRLMDINAENGSFLKFFQPSTLAPIALIIGIVLLMGFKFKRADNIGNIAVGFGILFTGLMNMTSAVSAFSESGIIDVLFENMGNNPVIAYLTGAGIAFVLQSSSATIGILQAFSMASVIPFKTVYIMLVGIYLGDCVTTFIVCSIGARADQKRVGMVNILFNLSETVLVLSVVAIIHRLGLLDGIWNSVVDSGMIANTNTVFNLGCAVALFPLLGTYEKLACRIIPDDKVPESKFKERLEALSPVFFDTPALALNSCYELLNTMLEVSKTNLNRAFKLLFAFDPELMALVNEDEEGVDLMADTTSRYMVNLLPHLTDGTHVRILNQYYRDVAEFERLGDNAVTIAETAEEMQKEKVAFSNAARQEVTVLKDLVFQIVNDAGQAFDKRDVEAAYHILPLEEVIDDFIDELKESHLRRMSSGECDVMMDTYFINLLTSIKRIAGICSNIGLATIIRVNPELTEEKHTYFAELRSGRDEQFNAVYKQTRDEYFGRLAAARGNVPAAQQNADAAQENADAAQQSADAVPRTADAAPRTADAPQITDAAVRADVNAEDETGTR